MNRANLIDLIAACVLDTMPSPGSAPTLDESTRLFGRGGTIDSMQLVNLLMEVEHRVNERCGTTISIADDRAMSQQRSPFRSIGNLADYVGTLLAEQNVSI